MTAHQVTKIRRESRRRFLTVTAVEHLTPRMLRIHFHSPELHDFDSGAPDDHIKLFFPEPTAAGAEPAHSARDYTPRRFDVAQGTLIVDFVVHDAGPATAWALAAKVGDALQIGGPRGSSVVSDDFDWYFLIGDETALPAIGRRVEELRAGVPVVTLVVVDTAADEQNFEARAAWQPHWVHRAGSTEDDAALLLKALAGLPLPSGEGYVWIAAEVQAARVLRSYFKDERGHPREWLKASGYWSRGEVAAHKNIED